MGAVAVDRLISDVLRIVDSEENKARLNRWETSLVAEDLENRIAIYRRLGQPSLPCEQRCPLITRWIWRVLPII